MSRLLWARVLTHSVRAASRTLRPALWFTLLVTVMSRILLSARLYVC